MPGGMPLYLRDAFCDSNASLERSWQDMKSFCVFSKKRLLVLRRALPGNVMLFGDSSSSGDFGLAASSWASLDSFEVCSFRREATGGLDQWRSSSPLSVASNCIWRLESLWFETATVVIGG